MVREACSFLTTDELLGSTSATDLDDMGGCFQMRSAYHTSRDYRCHVSTREIDRYLRNGDKVETRRGAAAYSQKVV